MKSMVALFCAAERENAMTSPDNHDIRIDLHSDQAALLLERLETLRSELGIVGEELIALLRGAGITPAAEPGPVREN